MRWGVISTGHIARVFVEGLGPSESEQVVAVASRERARAEEFASELGIAHGYGSYAELLADPEVEAVYVATPNSRHAEDSIAAARAGKHVLCEKPIGVGAAEAAEMFAIAREAGVWLMEAFMYRFHPRTLKVRELIEAGTIGEVQLVRASFGFNLTDPSNVRLSADLAGGALMDVGCYCVNFARMALGERPVRATAAARWAPSGVDKTLAGTLEYPSGALAQIACSLATSFNQTAEVIGSDGVIEVEQAFNLKPPRSGRMRVQRGRDSNNVEELTFEPVNQYRAEAEGFARLVAGGHQQNGLPEMPLADSLDNMATIEALLRSARSGQPVEVEQ
jgi:D-xylose 1-dehydrogenase (NADP+, D-xylono-1,5-lactone-forming)